MLMLTFPLQEDTASERAVNAVRKYQVKDGDGFDRGNNDAIDFIQKNVSDWPMAWKDAF